MGQDISDFIQETRDRIEQAGKSPVNLSQGNYLPVQQEKPDALGQSKFGKRRHHQ